ncbi:MAG: hypothetical protein WBM07_04355 [Chitinivibrionales bacterium]
MKSLNNRYRPPRMQYKLDDWAKKKNDRLKASEASEASEISRGPKSKKNKRTHGL